MIGSQTYFVLATFFGALYGVHIAAMNGCRLSQCFRKSVATGNTYWLCTYEFIVSTSGAKNESVIVERRMALACS